MSSNSSESFPGSTCTTITMASALQQQLAGLLSQLGTSHQPGPSASLPITTATQAAISMAAGDFSVPATDFTTLSRATSAGCMLRTLSVTNPRVLALATAAAKAAPGTPKHAAVLAALKDEIMQAASHTVGNASGNAAPAALRGLPRQNTTHHGPSSTLQASVVDPGSLQLPQHQPLTQDALWAALMARSAHKSGLETPIAHQQQKSVEISTRTSPRDLPGYGSSDVEAEGTSCSLPWALLQAAQQAQQEEEAKEAAEAATAAAAAAAAAAAEKAAAAAATGYIYDEAMVCDARNSDSDSPHAPAECAHVDQQGVSSSGGGREARINNKMLFKRRTTTNSNALQKHFSKHASAQQAAAVLSRSRSEAAAVHKPQHTFKKQGRKKPFVMHPGNGLMQQQLTSTSAQHGAAMLQAVKCEGSAEPFTPSAAAGVACNVFDTAAPSCSGGSSWPMAAAGTTPAASPPGHISEVMSWLCMRKHQLHTLQEEIQQQRFRLDTQHTGATSAGFSHSDHHTPLNAVSAAPSSPALSNSTAAALVELQRVLHHTSAVAAHPAAACQVEATRPDRAQQHAAVLSVVDQLKHGSAQEPSQGAADPATTLSALRALAEAVVAGNRFQQPAAAPAFGSSDCGDGSVSVLNASPAELLRKLAAAMCAST